MKNKTGWEERADGWHKVGGGESHLTNSVFSRPEPIVRNDAGLPMKRDRVFIDYARVIREINERDRS